jgi:hypothetical protein
MKTSRPLQQLGKSLMSRTTEKKSSAIEVNVHAPDEAAGFGGDEFNREHALMVGVRLHRVVDEAPVIAKIRAVDTPVGAARHVDVLLAVRPVADYEVRILLRRHFSKSLGRELADHGAMDSIVKLVWIQLQPDKLFDTTNKGKGFELGEIEIGIEVRGNFSARARYEEKQTEQHREQEERALTGAPKCYLA